MKHAIPYYRVSTSRQGRSGLGLEAQQATLEQFARSNGFALLSPFVEVESAGRNDRSILKQALQECRQQDAVLLIATLDRLARNVAFVSSLMEHKVRFIVADHPHVDDIILHMLAAFAEYERKKTSERTTAALAAAKRRGVMLGRYGKEVLSKRNRDEAVAFARSLAPVIGKLQAKGCTSIRDITRELNRRRVKTYRKGSYRWHPSTVHNLLKRLQAQHKQATTTT